MSQLAIIPRRTLFRVGTAFRRLLRSEGGNVTVISTLAMLPVLLAAGASIDYARLLSTRTALTAATDAAALQIANSKLTNQAALETQAANIIARNYAEDRFGELVSVGLVTDSTTVDLVTQVKFKTSFMQLAGIQYIDLAVTS